MLLLFPHQLFFPGRLISISTKMKGAMKDYAEQFPLKTFAHHPGIFPDPVNADIDLAFYGFAGNGQFKSDDIGKVIVLQVLPVDFQEPPIGAKNIVKRCKQMLLLPKQGLNKSLESGPLPERDRQFIKEADPGL